MPNKKDRQLTQRVLGFVGKRESGQPRSQAADKIAARSHSGRNPTSNSQRDQNQTDPHNRYQRKVRVLDPKEGTSNQNDLPLLESKDPKPTDAKQRVADRKQKASDAKSKAEKKGNVLQKFSDFGLPDHFRALELSSKLCRDHLKSSNN